jgi:hypothetical protein
LELEALGSAASPGDCATDTRKPYMLHHGMVTHVTHASHRPAYGRRMVVVTALVGLVAALSLGAAGDFVAWVVNGAGAGAWIASLVALYAERRGRHRAMPPWAEPAPVAVERYLWTGGLIGGAFGFVVAVVEAWPLA